MHCSVMRAKRGSCSVVAAIARLTEEGNSQETVVNLRNILRKQKQRERNTQPSTMTPFSTVDAATAASSSVPGPSMSR